MRNSDTERQADALLTEVAERLHYGDYAECERLLTEVWEALWGGVAVDACRMPDRLIMRYSRAWDWLECASEPALAALGAVTPLTGLPVPEVRGGLPLADAPPPPPTQSTSERVPVPLGTPTPATPATEVDRATLGVFRGAPQGVDKSMPHVNDGDRGKGVSAQRKGKPPNLGGKQSTSATQPTPSTSELTEGQRYRQSVDLATEVFKGAPQGVTTSRPHVDPKPNSGHGTQSQRVGYAPKMPPPGTEVAAAPLPSQTQPTPSTSELTEGQRYRQAVNLAAEVFSGAPPGVSLRRPTIKGDIGGGGRGVNAQRKGKVWEGHTRPNTQSTSAAATAVDPATLGVWDNAPPGVNQSMPKIITRDSGAGVSAQRQGLMTSKQPRQTTEGTLGTEVSEVDGV